MTSRVCKVCLGTFLFKDLVKAKGCKDGFQALCKKCNVVKARETRDKVKKAAYDKSRRDKIGERLRKYDRDRAKLPHRKALHNERTRKRKAALRDAIPEDYDKKGVADIYKLAQKLSVLTGCEMHVDHIRPISRGGIHNVGNLQILERTLNIAKGASDKSFLPHHEMDRKKYK